MLRLSIILVASFLFFSCGKNESRFFTKSKNTYSICLKVFFDKDSAITYTENLEERIDHNIFIDVDSLQEVSYKILIGEFGNSYLAGEAASKLFGKYDYSIVLNSHSVPDDFKTYFFVGKNRGLPSIFKFNITDNKTELVWSKNNESVVKLNHSGEKGAAFFLTASGYGRKGIFPFINALKLYRYDIQKKETSLLKSFGTGIQFYSFWENDNTFKVTFNQFHKMISTYVIEQSVIYNSNGVVLSDQNKTYDLVKENYPVPPDIVNNKTSPDMKYFLVDSSFDNKNIFVIRDDKAKLIASFQQKLNRFMWSNDSRYLVYSDKNGNSSGLYIYDLRNKKMVKNFRLGEFNNFLLRGDFLFFDSGYNSRSSINVYNFSRNKVVSTITKPGGCGIYYIPRF